VGELAGDSAEARAVIELKETEFGRESFLSAGRSVVLQTMDQLWVEHLESMEYLRGSVNLRAYGQRDPLTEYRREGTQMYKQMELMLADQTFQIFENMHKSEEGHAHVSLAAEPVSGIMPAMPAANAVAIDKDIQRNDQCPCGSGKKWKNCGMKNTEEHQQLMAQKV
jgi:preprotein translocase subunit SecA